MKGLYLSASVAALAAVASSSRCFADNGAAADDAAAQAGSGQADAAATAADEKPAKKVRLAHYVWVMPGHAQYSPGVMVRGDAERLDALRAAGHCRVTTDAEVAEHKKHGRPIADFK